MNETVNERKSRWIPERRTWTALLAIAVCLISAASHWRRVQREADALALAIAQLNIGTAAADAERLLVGPPDRTSLELGFITEHFTLLPVTNSRSTGLGQPQEYEVRVWERGSTLGAIIVDEDGRVAGKHLVRPMPGSGPSVWGRVREWCRQVLPF